AFAPKPAWQHDPGCTNRTIADISAVADPTTGVAVFVPVDETTSAWEVLGGTSVAAPIIAGMYGVNATGAHFASDVYSPRLLLFAVPSGGRGRGFCAPTYLCTAGFGYDGPTGVGTPKTTLTF